MHTKEEKIKALKYARKHTVRKAAEKWQVSHQTITGWCKALEFGSLVNPNPASNSWKGIAKKLGIDLTTKQMAEKLGITDRRLNYQCKSHPELVEKRVKEYYEQQ